MNYTFSHNTILNKKGALFALFFLTLFFVGGSHIFADSTGTVQGYKVLVGGTWPPSETIPVGETVTLDGTTSTTTDPYAFSNISSGSHTVSVNPPAGWSVTHTSCLDTENFSDPTCSENVPGNSFTFTLPAGGHTMFLFWNYVAPVVNRAPVLTVNGLSPLTIQTGSTFVDPGATAVDAIDGNISSHVTVSGSVNTATVGTYTVTYSVTDSAGLSASASRQVVVSDQGAGCNADVFSDTSNTVTDASGSQTSAVPTYSLDPAWTASIPGATWIWSSYTVQNPAATTTETFSKTFTLTGTTTSAVLTLASDNFYVVKVNGVTVATDTVGNSFNHTTPDTVNIAPYLTSGMNTLSISVTNVGVNSTAEQNPAGLAYHLSVKNTCVPITTNDTITGYKVLVGGTWPPTETIPVGETVALDNTTSTTTDPYTFSNISAGSHTVSVNPPVGWVVSHSACLDSENFASTTCIANQLGNSYTFTMPTGVHTMYLFWNYNAPSTVSSTTASVDISATNFVDNIHPQTGDVVHFTTTVKNLNASTTASSVSVADSLPAGLSFISAVASQGSYSNTTGTWTVGDVPATASATLFISASVTASTTGQVIIDTAVASETNTDPNLVNNTASASLTVSTPLACGVAQDMVIVSDTTNTASSTMTGVGTAALVASPYSGYWNTTNWTAVIPGASWIWVTPSVDNPAINETATFSKTFTVNGTTTSAVLTLASDNFYVVKVNGVTVATDTAGNSFSHATPDTVNIASFLTQGANTLSINVTNIGDSGSSAENPAGLIYRLEVKSSGATCSTNQPPVITLLGANPATVTVGMSFTDPGATALDPQDGDISSKIVASSTVNTSVVGTYAITYTVTDKEGLSAVPVVRTVNVVSGGGGGGGPTTGSVSFCLVTADQNNNIATSSIGLPAGMFTMNLATSTNFASSTIDSRTWNAMSFTPNQKTILGVPDSDCVSFTNLPFGTYYYSSTTVSGTLWNVPKYDDQETQNINNVFDFFPYSANATTTSPNSDGIVTINPTIINRTVVVYDTYNPAPTGPNADISITKTADKTTANVGDTVTYTITVVDNGPSTAQSVSATDVLPSGLTLVSATSTIGSYATSTGLWTIGTMADGSSTALTLVTTINSSVAGQTVTNTATASSSTLDLTPSNNTVSVGVNVNSVGCTSNCGGGGGGSGGQICTSCGGGGGGGGNGPIVANSLQITNEQVVETTPGIALVTWNTNVPATRRVVYGNSSNPIAGTAPNYGYPNSTVFVSTPLLTLHTLTVPVDDSQTYYFRPVSTDASNDIAVGTELTLAPLTTTSGGTSSTPTTSTTSTSCDYLHDYLRQDFNNNPVEVDKLQVFLKDLEGDSSLPITGVYDNATVAAVDAFQVKYANDILTPWGYDGTTGTGYTYILTKNKVNEIYCDEIFPLTAQQQSEIDATRAFLQTLRAEGINVTTPTNTSPSGIPAPIIDNMVGVGTSTATTTSENNLATGEPFATTTHPLASSFGGSITNAGHDIGVLAAAIFGWPFSMNVAQSAQNMCVQYGRALYYWLIALLVVAIVAILYFWYRERENNKKIEELNKEIDLK